MTPVNKKNVKVNTKRIRTGSEAESSSSLPTFRETVKPPVKFTLCSKTSDTLSHLQKLCGLTKRDSVYKHPIIIGSRAAAYWLPSFRSCADWDLIATPQQAISMVEILQEHESKTEVQLVIQPLDINVIKRRQVTTDVQEVINALPSCLYKVVGELKGKFRFEIEITPTDKDHAGLILETSSTAQLFKICNSDDVAYTNFPIGPDKGYQCIVAPLEVLETVKCSHIYWPAYFSKHIADIHTIRAVLAPSNQASSSVNMGVRADKNKPLTSPDRTPELEHFLLTRTLETEAFRGTPGAHINLNVSNEDFLGRDDDLFVTRYIPHDSVHDIVKYGDTPIYDQLKTDKSKAMISRDLFEKTAYDQQLKCVKEESMVIALERFFLPGLSDSPISAYKSALIRICTTLTKGWFREFAVDNFPRLAICDMDLLPIRDQILKDHPLPPRTLHEPLVLLKKMVPNLENLATVQKLIPLAQPIKQDQVVQYMTKEETKRRRIMYGMNNNYDNYDGMKYDNPYRRRHNREEVLRFWTIQSCIEGQDPLLISFSNNSDSVTECEPSWTYNGAISVRPLKKVADLKFPLNCEKLGISVSNTTSGGSWGGEDIWSYYHIDRRDLADEVNVIGMEGLTEDLLWTFIVSLTQPRLYSNGETPLVNAVNVAKSRGLIPLIPINHLWYDLWKYDVKQKQ